MSLDAEYQDAKFSVQGFSTVRPPLGAGRDFLLKMQLTGA